MVSNILGMKGQRGSLVSDESLSSLGWETDTDGWSLIFTSLVGSVLKNLVMADDLADHTTPPHCAMQLRSIFVEEQGLV